MNNKIGKPPEQLVGVAEAAAMLGISKAALAARRSASGHRPGFVGPADRPVPFPEPLVVLACGPIWRRSQITGYMAAKRSQPSRRR